MPPSSDAALKSFLEGVTLTERELLNVLERYGIRKIIPHNEPFNPHVHQAVMEMQRTDVPAGTVVQVFQAGFVIEDRVLRPAMVAVAKGGPKPAPASEGQNGAGPASSRQTVIPPNERHPGAFSRPTRRSVRLRRPPSASRVDVPGRMRSMPW